MIDLATFGNKLKGFFSQARENLQKKEKGNTNFVFSKKNFSFYVDEQIKVKLGLGQFGAPAYIPWMGFLGSNQAPQEGIYPVILCYLKQHTTIITYGVSSTRKPLINWNNIYDKHGNPATTIGAFFKAKKIEVENPDYNNCYIYSIYSDILTDDEISNIYDDINILLGIYRKTLNIAESNKSSSSRQSHIPILELLTSKFIPYLTALRTKPFMLLAGISGTGKSRIVRKLAQATTTQAYEKDEERWKDNRPENFELIQVKPNWHNSMDVVGFYSNISNKYEFTPFVEFIVKAWQHTGTPYFLCLDEMNLAPVEEYFAEFLSAIESRSTDKDGNYVTDPIIKPFKEFGKEACEEMLKHFFGEALYTESNPLAKQFAEKGLTLPPNLMVMGTVNMDETTFSFSRKVLDRAMSVEMNEVDYDSFLSGESDQFPVLTELNELLVNRPQQASEVKEQIDSEKVIAYLKAVNELMEGTPFKLGYRAANEALLYVSASKDFAGEEFELERSLDEFTLMKILSRLEGDDNRLAIDEDDPRIASIGMDAIIDNGEDRINLLNSLRAIVRKHIGTDTSTEKKINAMYRTLEREHFVSYWA